MANKKRITPLITYTARIPKPLYDLLKRITEDREESINTLLIRGAEEQVAKIQKKETQQ